MCRNLFYKLEVSGIIFTLAIGFILRYAYVWTDGAAWTVVFASVNTSIWEQIKVFGLPYLAWAVITLAASRPGFMSFFTAKIIGAYIIVFGQMLLYSLFSGIVGKRVTALEIIATVLAVFMGYITSSRITFAKDIDTWFVTALFALLLFIASYFCFTYSPPQVGLFIDETTSTYGVPASEEYYADDVLDAMYNMVI